MKHLLIILKLVFYVGLKHLNLLLQNTKPTKSDLSSSQGVLFLRNVNGGSKWFEDGDEDNDRKYIGEYKDGKRNGQGTETFPNGNKYVGEFKDGKRNGQGTTTLPNGDKFVGGWKEGKPWNGTYYDKEGNILGKWVNGKMIKQ